MQQKQTKKKRGSKNTLTHQLSPAWIHKSFEDKIQKTHSCSKENSASQHVTALIFPIFPACVYLGVILHMHVPSLFLLRFCRLLLFQQPLYGNNPGFSLNHGISVHSKYWECSNRYELSFIYTIIPPPFGKFQILFGFWILLRQGTRACPPPSSNVPRGLPGHERNIRQGECRGEYMLAFIYIKNRRKKVLGKQRSKVQVYTGARSLVP